MRKKPNLRIHDVDKGTEIKAKGIDIYSMKSLYEISQVCGYQEQDI